jgi:hypothetical protein
MDKVTAVVRSAAVIVALVLVVAVTGAFADGVAGGHHYGAFIESDFHMTFNPIAASHVNLTSDQDGGSWRFSGLRDGYWLRGWKKDAFSDNDDAWSWSDPSGPTDPVSATPEPGTLLLLAAGIGFLLFMGRRTAFQT